METSETLNMVSLIEGLSRVDLVSIILNTVWFHHRQASDYRFWTLAGLQQKSYEILMILGEAMLITSDATAAQKWRDEKKAVYPPFLNDRPTCNRPRGDQFLACGTDENGDWIIDEQITKMIKNNNE